MSMVVWGGTKRIRRRMVIGDDHMDQKEHVYLSPGMQAGPGGAAIFDMILDPIVDVVHAITGTAKPDPFAPKPVDPWAGGEGTFHPTQAGKAAIPNFFDSLTRATPQTAATATTNNSRMLLLGGAALLGVVWFMNRSK